MEQKMIYVEETLQGRHKAFFQDRKVIGHVRKPMDAILALLGCGVAENVLEHPELFGFTIKLPT